MTYQQISEQIRTMLYGGIPSDDAAFSLRYIAELVAQEVAVQARKNAFENSNAGETTYANDTFTSTFTSVAVTYNSTLKQNYSVLPQIPTALPNNQEIVSITPLGIIGRRRQIVLMKNKDKFMQDMLPPVRGFILAYIEDGKLYYDNIQEYMFTSVNITMVGAISSTGDLLSANLNVPKSVESEIIGKIFQMLRASKGLPEDVMNDARDLSTVQ
jgi:hypothetical protein|tara:strand:- start:33 stop:674 length:642 start_codon:yes stop_codon:yes gene_type:complete